MLSALIGFVLKFLSGPMVDRVLSHLEKKADTQTERERIRTQATIEEIRAEVEAQKAGKEILVAEQGRWYTAIVRPLFALPFIIYTWKLVVWDKVFGLGETDNLSPDLWNVMLTILGAYFIGRTAEKVASIVTTRK